MFLVNPTGTEIMAAGLSEEMCNYAQILADLFCTEIRLLQITSKSINGEFKTDEKSYDLLGIYSPINRYLQSH